MRKYCTLILLLFFTTILCAQSVTELTPQQRLEKAKREAAEAKLAIKEAKAAAKNQEKALKQQQKDNQKAQRLEEKIAKKEAEAQRLKEQAEKERQRLNQQQSTQQAVPTIQYQQPAKAEAIPVPPVQEKKAKEKETVAEAPAAANNGWTAPVASNASAPTEKSQATAGLNRNDEYLQGAVPELDGKVIFTLEQDAPGKSAEQIYDITYRFLEQLASDTHQRKNENSAVALVNKEEGKIVARLNEWIVFSSNALSLDRTKFNYVIMATCTDGHLHLTMERLNYNYEENRSTGFRATAEELIADKIALNKKGELVKLNRRFRTKTIDRKNEIFNQLSALLK